MALTRQAKDHLIAELAERLGIFKLHAQVHRTEAAVHSLARQLEARGLVSVVKTFRRAGPDPFLLERVGQQLLSGELRAGRSRSISRRKAATRRSLPRDQARG